VDSSALLVRGVFGRLGRICCDTVIDLGYSVYVSSLMFAEKSMCRCLKERIG
jgi:hypothetical protein